MDKQKLKELINFVKGTLTEMVQDTEITIDEANVIAPIIIQEEIRKEKLEY